MVKIVSRLIVKKKRGRSRNCVLFLGTISVSLSSFQKVQLRAHPRETLLPNKCSPMAGVPVHLVAQLMVDGVLAHTRLQVAVEVIGEVILTHRLRVVVAVVGEELVTLQGETVILTVRERIGALLEETPRHIGVGVVIGVGDGRPRTRVPEAHRGGELRGTINF